MAEIVVIGGGPGGNVAALVAARHGAGGEVVLVEKGTMGGTCTNRGCIPTKFLLSRLGRSPLSGRGGEGEWKRVVSHKNALVRGLASSIEKSCREAGVTIIRGHGRLAGSGAVEVEAEGGGIRRLEARKVIIATGSAPAGLAGAEIDGEGIISSTEALLLDRPPRTLVIVGSGAVGAEFAFIFQRAGTRVTVVEAADRLFPGEDREVHDLFSGLFEKMGVATVTGDPVAAVSPGGALQKVELRSGRCVEAERVLVGVGRRLLTDDIGLDTVGLKRGERGEVAVDDDLMTAAPDVYAVGDVTGRLLLAHLASSQGAQAALRALGRGGRKIPYHAVPWSIFTTPEIATVGLNETEAGRRGIPCRVSSVPWMDNVKSRIDRETDGFVKVVAHGETGRLIGGTIVGAHASDMIHIISSAVHQGLTTKEMTGMIFAHPGLAETIHDALEKLLHAHGES